MKVFKTKNWRDHGEPMVGSAGINMLQLVPERRNWKGKYGSLIPYTECASTEWTPTMVNEIEEQPECFMQRAIEEYLSTQNMSYMKAVELRDAIAQLPVYANYADFLKITWLSPKDEDLWEEQMEIDHESRDVEPMEVVDCEFAVTQGGGESKPQQGNVNGSQNQGINIYNYYNQQYQNSVDMSAPMLNAGGSNPMGTSSSHNTTSNSLSGLLTAGFNMASNLVPLMLMDPDTEESTELPDRITEDTAGNTNITTQSSVGTLVAYHQLRSKHPVTSCADKPTIGGPAMERNFVQYIGTWETAQVEYQCRYLPLPHGLEEMGVFETTAIRHYTMKCGWKIQVQLNTSHFHAGCLGVFAVPEAQWVGKFTMSTEWEGLPTDMRPESFFLYPHQLINCRTNTSVDLILPYLNFVPTSAYGYHCPWTLVFMVLTPLQIPTGASPVIDISCTVVPQWVQYNGLRQPQTITQGFAGHIRENQAMYASTIPDETTPVYGLGFNPNTDFVPGEVHNFLEWTRTPCLMSNVVDDTIRGYFTASNTRSDEPLLQMDVTLASDHMRYTALGQMSFRYAQYRGSINVMLTFTGAAMVKGKFLLAYTPPGAERPSTIEEAMQATYAIWDLGLQSSYDFTIPFISVSDFRLTASGIPSTISVDGWFTVFQYTALTYPANTPQRSDVLVFISSGQDMCFRNIIDTREKNNDMQGLDNAEEGASENPTTIEDFEGKELGSLTTHTGLGFVFDRSFGISHIKLDNTASYTMDLSMEVLMTKELAWWLSSVTYFKADLEITVLPIMMKATPFKLAAKFYPVGSTVNIVANPTSTEGFLTITGPCPMILGMDRQPLTFAVPYTSPLSVMPTKYLGFADYARTELANWAPGASFGALRLGLLNENQEDKVAVLVFVRFKNFRAYCPRPFKNAGQTPTNSRAKVVTTDDFVVFRSAHQDVTLGGDVETNPGPTILTVPYETARTQGLEKLYNFVSGGIFQHVLDTTTEAKDTVNGISRATNAFGDIIENFKKMSDMAVEAMQSVKQWISIVRKMFRMFCYLIIAYRTKDPVVIGLLGVDMAFGDPFDIIEIVKNKLQKIFSTPAPPIATTQGVSDLNALFSLLKNGEWAVKLILTIKDWLNRWIAQEMDTPEKQLQKLMPELLEALEIMEKKDAESQKKKPTLLPKIQHASKLARMCNRMSIANYCDSVLKPFAMSGKQRTEPVVIVLKGKPGQGKTVAATLLAQMISKSLVGTQSVYSLPPDSKHMDGYNGQTVVIMDDLGQNPDGLDFATFCQMVSTTQFVTPQASLADKGTCFTSPVIIATTNLGDFRPVTIADPGAVKRRIFLELDVSAGVKTPSGCLDLAAAMQETSDQGLINTKPDCLTTCPKLMHSAVLKLTETRINVTFSLIDVFNRVMRQLKQKEEMTDLLANVVMQGVVTTEVETVKGSIIEKVTHDGEKVTIYDVQKEKTLLDNTLQNFLVAVALVPTFITILSILVNVISYFFGTQEEEKQEEEAEAEGPYCGTCRQKKPVLKKAVTEGPYTGIVKKAPKKLKKVVTQTTEEVKELKARFVKVTPEEIAETQGPKSDAEASLLERNTTPVTYLKDGKEVSSLTAIKLCSGKALINKHQFDKDIWDTMVIDGIKQTRDQCQIVGFTTKRGIAYDLYVVDVPKMQCRNIVSMFTDEQPKQETLVGCCNSTNYQKMMWHGEVLRCVENLHTNDGILPKTIAYKTPTRAGFCGAPLTARRGGQLKIIAVHSAGNGVNGFGTLISKKMIEEAVTQGIIYDERPGPFVAVNRKTQIKRSPLFPLFQPEAGPAVLSQYDRRLADGIVLDEALFEKHVSDMDVLPKEFEIACDMYAEELFARIGRENGLVSMYRAMNGDGISDAMDMTRAVGYPYCLDSKKRLDMVEIVETENGKLYLPTEQLVEETEKYFTGEEKPKFVTFLKDEVRSNEKIKQGKTRIVDASPFPYAIAGRMVMQNFMSNMMRCNGTEVGSAVGCDPDTEWTRYFFELCDKYVFDLDYKAFDSTHPTAMFNLLAERFFTERNGFDQQAVRIFLNGLSDSDHVYEGKHFRIRGGLPSGCPCTSILNTVINNIIVRAAIIGAYQIDTVDFQKFRMLAYGDDVVYATPQPIKPQDLADWLHANTNYKVTPASKAGTFPEESTIWDVTFLKRSFKPDEDHGHLIRPQMAVGNLRQMLSFMRPGTFPDKVRSVAGLAVHCGEEVYNQLADAVALYAPGVSMPAYKYMKACWYAKMV
ncbi:polyprotein [mosavirus A1]|uniref:Genome polyprotein n=1 Tax=mosavirus A1 TaxID=2779845 RepID=G1DFA4_9PICO|nr:polyprotein [Mouse Mosavirus]AEM05833.1 polyprotein [mosavirus A1]